MNTLEKIGASIGVTVLPVATFVGIALGKDSIKEIGEVSVLLYCCNTLPAALSTVADKYVFQNLTDNKALQYGLTAATAFAEQVCYIFDDMTLKNHFWMSNTARQNVGNTILKASVVAQACAFKWIWDQDSSEEVVLEEISVEDPLSTEGYEAEFSMTATI